MPSGFQCFGDHGYIQVDENFANFALINKVILQGTTAANAGIPAGNLFNCQWVSYTARSMQSLLALHSTSAFAVFNIFEQNGTFVYKIACMGQIEIYEFGPPPTNSGSGAGIQVFNEGGGLVFSSDFAYMRVIDIINSNFLAQNWDNTNRTYPGSPRCGIIAGLGACAFDSYQDFPGQWQNAGRIMTNKCIGGGIQINSLEGYSYSQSTTVQGSALQEGKFTILVVNINDL